LLFEAGTTNAKNGGEPVRPDQSPVGHARQLEPGSPVIVETIGIGLYLVVLPGIPDDQVNPIGFALRYL